MQKLILNQLDTEILGIMNATEEKIFGNVLAGGFQDMKRKAKATDKNSKCDLPKSLNSEVHSEEKGILQNGKRSTHHIICKGLVFKK